MSQLECIFVFFNNMYEWVIVMGLIIGLHFVLVYPELGFASEGKLDIESAPQ